MLFRRRLFQQIFLYTAISLSLIWAVIVVVSYMSVDNNFALMLTRVPVTIRHLFIFVGIFFGFILFDYAVGQSHRNKIIVGALGLLAFGIVARILYPTLESFQATWFKVNGFTDGVRASLMIAMAALLGGGIGLGARLSKRAFTLGILSASIFIPFLYVTLRAGAITSLLALIWLFLLADAIGKFLFNWLNHLVNTPSTLIDHAGLLSIAVGLSVLILVTLGLGLAGGTSVTGILLLLLLISTLCFKQIKFSLTRFVGLPWNQPVTLSEFEWGGGAMLVALFLIYWIGALAPEVGADALGVRAAAPAIWLREGSIHALPEMLYSYAMFGGEMLYLLVMPFTGYPAAKVIQFGLSVLLVISTIIQVFERRHRKDAALIVFAFWGCTQVWWQMIWGFADLSQMFFYFACILALRFWLDEPESPIWLIAAGIVGATSTSVKLNGGGSLVIAALIVAVVTIYQTRSLVKVIKNSLYLIIPSLLYLLPWLIRSYWLTKNPVFPFLNEFFKSPLVVVLPVAPFGVGLSFPKILTVPWGIFFDPATYGSFTYHPLILATALLGFVGLAWVSSKKDWLWLGTGAFAFITWLVTEQNSRYSLYAVYLIALSFGIGLLKWRDRFPVRLQRVVFQALLLIGLIWGFTIQAIRPSFWIGGTTFGPAFPVEVVFSEQSEDDYLVNNVPTYFCAEWINHHYGQNAKIWQLPPIRDVLYFDAPAYSQWWSILPITKPLNDILFNPNLAADHVAVYQDLIDSGYTHLISDVSLMWWVKEVPEYQREGVFSTDFETAYLQLECADRGVRLYGIRQTPNLEIKHLQLQPNLLVNSGFEVLNISGLPVNWDLSGDGKILNIDGNNFFGLENNAIASQFVSVKDYATYELSADYRATSANPSASIQINWLDSSGQLRLFWRESLNLENGFSPYRFLQTAPGGVRVAYIYVAGSGVSVDNLVFREILNEVQFP